jgi:GntR family transcriptional regulator
MLIDPKSSTPIFRQIADQLRQAIDSKVYKPGEMLPSLRAMAIDINVNPNTVQRAYEALEREGVVETRRGVGIFVTAVNRNRLNAAEQRLSQQFAGAIRQGVKASLTPDTIRSVFEDALRQTLVEVKKC